MRFSWLKLCVVTMLILVGLGAELKFIHVTADSPSVSNLQQLQSVLSARLEQRAQQFTIQYTGNKEQLSERLPDVLKQAIRVDDYTAYIVDSYYYTIHKWSNTAKLKITINYRETKQQTRIVDSRVKAVLAGLLRSDMNEHEKVKAIHDWIVYNVAYDSKLQHYTAYEAIVNGRAVCQGYALLAHKMLTEAGLQSRIVEGKVASGDHAWNLVNVDGVWYHLDVTWDDPVPDQGRNASYEYYLLSDEQMRKDHAWTEHYPTAKRSYQNTLALLQATDEARSAYYAELEQELGYIWLKAEHTAKDSAALRQRIEQAIASKEGQIKLRYLNGKQIENDVFEAVTGLSDLSAYHLRYQSLGHDGAVLLELSITLK